MNQFRVLLCSDSALYGQGLAVAFDESYTFRVLDNVNLQEMLASAIRLQPDVLLFKLDTADYLPNIVELKNKCPFSLPVVIVEDPNHFNLFELINCGVRGCLPMRLLPRQIVNAVELIVVAGILCLPRINPRSLTSDGYEKDNNIAINALTSREREVLAFLGRSFSNQEIAESLCLSESTVKTHLRNAFKKLKVRNRTEALAVILGSDIFKKEHLAQKNTV